MPDALCIEHLSVAFDGDEVLHDVSLTCADRSLTVLIGRSGSGKSTLLRAVNRLNEEFPACRTTGRVCVDMGDGLIPVSSEKDSPAVPLPLLRRSVGMVFQTPDVFPVSVERNITLPLESVLGLRHRDAQLRAAEALELAGLWEEVRTRLDLGAEGLSGGQKQRLCLARVLALRPRMLLLDEPTASLDIHAARGVEDVLRALAGTLPIVMVSHSLAQARRLAERIVVLEQGRITHDVSHPQDVSEATLAQWLCASDAL